MSGNAYVYIESQANPPLWTVGHYEPNGKWHDHSDHAMESDARAEVRELNGAPKPRNKDLLDLEVAEALATLRKKYPKEYVSWQVALFPDGKVEHTGAVKDADGISDPEFGWSSDCHTAIEHLVARAGERNPETRKQARIEALRKELAELEGAHCVRDGGSYAGETV